MQFLGMFGAYCSPGQIYKYLVFISVTEEGMERLNKALTFARHARKLWVDDLLPREELVNFAYAFPLAFYAELGHVHIGDYDDFYFSGTHEFWWE